MKLHNLIFPPADYLISWAGNDRLIRRKMFQEISYANKGEINDMIQHCVEIPNIII